jgi:hypothetical protein
MLEKFTVIDLIKSRSASVLTISGNTIKFNNQTAQELEYPEYIQFLVNAKDKQVAIRVCKENEPNSLQYCKDGVAPKYAIKLSLPVVTSIIRKMTNWQEKDSWNIPAVYFADEKALVYDLSAAYAPTKKGGWSARRESESAAAEAALNMSVEE